MANKNLDQLIADAEARVAKLRAQQRDKDRREAGRLGKRLQSAAAKGRRALEVEMRTMLDELAPADPAPAEAVSTADSVSGGEDHDYH